MMSTDTKNTEWLLEELLMFKKTIQVVLGQAGTGKSYLIDKIKERYDGHILLCATSGKAAVNIGGKTIHRSFALNVHRQFNPDYRVLAELRKTKLLIIDEISMCSCSLLKDISNILCSLRNNNQSFGGVKVILFGDMKQLPPVPEKELGETNNDDLSFYKFKVFKDVNNVRFFNLNTIHRQEDDIVLKEILQRIRKDNLTDEDIAILNTNYSEKITFNKDYTYLCSVKKGKYGVISINDSILEIDSCIEDKPIYRSIRTEIKKEKIHGLKDHIGKFQLPDNDEDIPYSIKFSEGCPVMFYKNDCITRDRRTLRWTNGTMGVIRKITTNEQNEPIEVEIAIKDPKTPGISKVEKVTKEAFPYEGKWLDTNEYFELGKYYQFPFVLAFAMTIDKSQGQTLDDVAIVLSENRVCDNLLYVALSRVRHLENIHVEHVPITREQVKMSHRFEEYIEKYKPEIEQIY